MQARRIVLTLLAVLLLAAPASAQSGLPRLAEGDQPLISGNVSLLTTIPVGKPVGARFRDGLMYVTGTEGLTIYDISNPAQPVPKGALPLPHFENEDVDLGGNTLLISNDPSEGAGVLYVIDISDPSAPRLAGALGNGFAGDSGLAAIFGVPYPLDAGVGHTASCVKADCSWAYLAGTDKGITIVDLRDPSKPAVAGQFVPDITGLATHDVQVDANGLAWIAGAEGTAAYDVTDPVRPKLVARSDPAIKNSGQLGTPTIEAPGLFTVGGDGSTPIDLIHHDSLRLGELAPESVKPAPPKGASGPKAEAPPTSQTPGEPVTIAPGSSAAATKPAAAKKARKRRSTRCRTKKQKRTKYCRAAARAKKKARKKVKARAAVARPRATSNGSFDLKPFKQTAGKTYPAGGDSPLFGVVEEDYNRPTCQGAGEFQTWGMTSKKTSTGAQQLGLLDRYQTELNALVEGRGWAPVTGLCSAHYFDYRDGIVAGGWYEEGTRFLDVRDPANIRQVGYWVPAKGETWSVLFPPTDPTGEIVYALDFARGIDVLRLDRGDLKPREAPVRRSWIAGANGPAGGRTARTGLTQQGRFGFVCRAITF